MFRALVASLAIGLGLLPGAALASVLVSEAVDEGLPVFKVTTDVATYFLSKGSGSLISLHDAEGVDWIDYHPETPAEAANGSFGPFRGLPNLTRQGFGHSAGEGAVSVTAAPLDQPLDRATIISAQGPWQTRWEFFSSFARLTVTGAGDNYWFLYEGVPGGELDPGDLCWAAGDEPAPCTDERHGDIPLEPDVVPDLEWMVFGDPALNRSLILLHKDDAVADQHRLMTGMTVFGFGRSDPGRFAKVLRVLGLGSERSAGRLPKANDTLLITFAESVSADAVDEHLRTLAGHEAFRPWPATVTAHR